MGKYAYLIKTVWCLTSAEVWKHHICKASSSSSQHLERKLREFKLNVPKPTLAIDPSCCCFAFGLFLCVLGIEPKPWHVLSRSSTPEPYPSALCLGLGIFPHHISSNTINPAPSNSYPALLSASPTTFKLDLLLYCACLLFAGL